MGATERKLQFGPTDFYEHLYGYNIDGYVQAVQLDGKVNKVINKKDGNVIELANEIEMQESWYMTVNTMYIPFRSVDNIRQFRALYIDLDLEGTEYTKQQAVYELYSLAVDKKIPMYSMLVDSGRGIHAYWRIEDAPKQAISTWQELEHYLYYNLKHLGADRKATDAARVLRAPRTVNVKCNELTKIIWVDEDLRYSMRDLREEYLNYKPKKYKTTKKQEPRRKVVSNAFFNAYSLHMERAEDLYALCKLRNFKVTGYRNMIIHCYAYWKGLIVQNDEELAEIVNKLNDSFTEPLKGTEIKTILKTVGKQVEKFIKYDNEFRAGVVNRKVAKKNDKPGYWYKNQTLIERLDITEEEQKELKTIISKEEKYSRKNNKRNAARRNEEGLTKKQVEKQKLKAKVLELKEQGLSNRAVAKELNVSEGTVRNALKK